MSNWKMYLYIIGMYINRDSKIWETNDRSSRAYASTLCMTSIVQQVLVEMKFVCTFFDGRLLRQQHFIYIFSSFFSSFSLCLSLLLWPLFFFGFSVCFVFLSLRRVMCVVALCGFIILRAYSMNEWMCPCVCGSQ